MTVKIEAGKHYRTVGNRRRGPAIPITSIDRFSWRLGAGRYATTGECSTGVEIDDLVGEWLEPDEITAEPSEINWPPAEHPSGGALKKAIRAVQFAGEWAEPVEKASYHAADAMAWTFLAMSPKDVRLDLLTARPHGPDVLLTTTSGGKLTQFLISRSAAASAIARIAEALAKVP